MRCCCYVFMHNTEAIISRMLVHLVLVLMFAQVDVSCASASVYVSSNC